MREQKPIPSRTDYFTMPIKKFWRATKNYMDMCQNDWVAIILISLVAITIVGIVIALLLGCMMIMPFLLVWAINMLAPIFGSTLVIPYSIPLLLAIAVVIMALRAIFRRG